MFTFFFLTLFRQYKSQIQKALQRFCVLQNAFAYQNFVLVKRSFYKTPYNLQSKLYNELLAYKAKLCMKFCFALQFAEQIVTQQNFYAKTLFLRLVSVHQEAPTVFVNKSFGVLCFAVVAQQSCASSSCALPMHSYTMHR